MDFYKCIDTDRQSLLPCPGELSDTAQGIIRSWWPMAAARAYEAPQCPLTWPAVPGLVMQKEDTSFPNANCLKVSHLLSLKDEHRKIYRRRPIKGLAVMLGFPSH